MARSYRNPSNAARESPTQRAALIAEAGEVFTPAEIVYEMLARKEVAPLIVNPNSLVLEPAAGDGNFLVPIITQRLRATRDLSGQAQLTGLQNIFAVELQPDNVLAMRERALASVQSEAPDLWASQPNEVTRWLSSNLLEGNFLTRHGSLLSCPENCAMHVDLAIPSHFDLAIGNPPYNPAAMYRDFTTVSLSSSHTVAFILPTTWKLADAHQNFRRSILPHLRSVDDLPWDTFQIKLHTSVVLLRSDRSSESFKLNGKSSSAAGRQRAVANSILTKAYRRWGQTLSSHQTRPEKLCRAAYPLYVGWKCNLKRDGERVNALQSLALSPESPLLPSNRFLFTFKTDAERQAWCQWSSTKLAAYLQSLTDSDTVSRRLPMPPLSPGRAFLHASDDFLYSELNLTPSEIKEVERHRLFVSAKAAIIYDALGVQVRPDAVLGKKRTACEGCGSSSFHKKGCPNSTEKERMIRDGSGVPEGHQTLLKMPGQEDE